ncbi:MAG: glycosyltransferase family 2 protein [Candidatus Saccharicenans sp.]
MKISAVVVTYNNEKKIEGCLESLEGIADEIVVVDSLSTDGTRKIATQFTDKIIKHSSTDYAFLKNLGQKASANEWILSLEPYERLSTRLRLELLKLRSQSVEVDGFYIPRRSFYIYRWIRHSGWYPDYRVRLYQKEKGSWKKEKNRIFLDFSGRAKKLKSPVEHLGFSSISEQVIHINRIAERRAQELYARKKKTRLDHLFFWPAAKFLYVYLLKLGFLDGFAGLVISTLSAYSVFLKFAKLKEIWKKGEKIEFMPGCR